MLWAELERVEGLRPSFEKVWIAEQNKPENKPIADCKGRDIAMQSESQLQGENMDGTRETGRAAIRWRMKERKGREETEGKLEGRRKSIKKNKKILRS